MVARAARVARHHAAADPRSRRTRLLVGAVLAAVVLAAAAIALWPRGGGPAPTAAVTDVTTPPTAVSPDPAAADPDPAAADPDRSAERPSRGGAPRANAPEASPPPQTEAAQTEAAESEAPEAADPPDAVPDSGDVVTSGTCEASYYWEPQPTASGEMFDPEALTAAHLTWDFGTRVRVTNPANGQSVVVRINDRGPYVDGRCLDLARGAFREIASLDQGVVTVTYEVLSD